MRTYMLSFLLTLFCVATCHAQLVDVRGTASITYKEKVTPEIRNEATVKATMKAVEGYFASLGEAETENFEKNVDVIKANLEGFVQETTPLSDKDEPDYKRFSVSLRVKLNVAKLRTTIRKSSVVSSGTGEKSKMIFIFIGREVAEVKSFDDRVTKIAVSGAAVNTENSTQKQGKESERIGAASVATSSSKNVKSQANAEITNRSERGGSTIKKANQVSYSVFSGNEMNIAVKKAFSDAGYAVVDAAGALAPQLLAKIRKEFASDSTMSDESKVSIAIALKQKLIPYFVVATLDVGLQDKDPATGQDRVAVSVTGEALDASGEYPETIGAVPPRQIFATSSDAAQARTAALSRAAQEASRELVSQLNAKSVR